MKVTPQKLIKAIANPQKAMKHLKKQRQNQEYEKMLMSDLNITPERMISYRNDFEGSGLVKELDEKLNHFRKTVKGKTVRGQEYSTGAMNFGSGLRLYSLIREWQPEIVVETGVCNGASTSYLLLALEHNKKGKLYSIDYPEIAGKDYDYDHFWDGKGGSVIPHGKISGWMIPDYLRHRWTLFTGKSQDHLPPLLKEQKEIDVFIHDSDHSYECMYFEFEAAFDYLKSNGLMLSHDIDMNESFQDFTKKHDKTIQYLDWNLGYFVK